jgi:hypothetical protein
MHILFIHQNFPAQFGHIAAYLVKCKGYRCTFASQAPPGNVAGIECLQYQVKGGATEQTHYCSRSFENAIWHSPMCRRGRISDKEVQAQKYIAGPTLPSQTPARMKRIQKNRH